MKKIVEQALKRIQVNPQFTNDVALVYTEILALEERNAESLALLAKVAEVIASNDLRARKDVQREVLRMTQDLHTRR